jgi:hypothetical protein
MEYGNNIGKETVSREYKEFTFNHGGLEIDNELAEELVNTSKWCFNNMILKSIKKYIKIYIPKYASAFLNQESMTDKGDFYIGISDSGCIQGIPYQGDMDIEYITSEIKKTVSKYIKADNMDVLTNSIEVNLINVDYYHTEITKHTPLYNEYVKQVNKIKKKEDNFKKVMTLWNKIHKRYAQKLVDLFNLPSTRFEIKTYIQQHYPECIVIKFIENGYRLECKTHEEINELKNFPEEPYYWVCKFKDEHLEEIRKKRPIPIYKNEIASYLNPLSVIIKTSNMIPWWMQNNDNMKLYVIQVTFTKKKDNKKVYYLDTFGKYNRCYRSIDDNKPFCQPI